MPARSALYLIDPENYFAGVIKILKHEIKGKNVIYVTTNKPYAHLVATFEKNKIPAEKIFFIDCITKHIGGDVSREYKNCMFVDGPQSLTGISIAINESAKFLKHKMMFLDSLSTLLMYNDSGTVGKFTNFIINKLRSSDIDSVMLALECDVNKDIVMQIESFVDEVKRECRLKH